MAKRHKHAGASASIETSLDAAEIAQLCESAAKHAETLQVLIRLEESTPGRLVYSARNRVVGGRVEFMTFDVRLQDREQQRLVTTRIISYKQRRSWILFIPLPWQMMAWTNYRKFMYGLTESIRTVDARSTSRVAEQVGV
jgi:hypothetical protein